MRQQAAEGRKEREPVNTEETAFMHDSAEDVKRENRAISKFFEYLEEEGFTVQQVKNIASRINARITSASIACDMRTPFQKKDTL
jgi:hypothetical protein